MREKIIFSLSLSLLDQWKTEIEQLPGFSHFEKLDKGCVRAIDIDGAVISVYAPENAEQQVPVTMDTLNQQGTSEPQAIQEQSPTNADSVTEGQMNPRVPAMQGTQGTAPAPVINQGNLGA